MEAIKVFDISKAYSGSGNLALDNINFSVQKGRVHGLLGPNGAGKSTTMKIISGLLRASSGKVEIFGQDISKNSVWAKSNIGVLPERPPLYMDMIVGDYLHFCASIHDVARREIKKHVQDVVEKTRLGGLEKRLIGNLSKGHQQRVGIAQAMVFRPKILILDEPTSGLDPASIIEIRNLIDSLRGEQTILLSTHLLHEVTRCCSELTIIHNGKIQVSDSLEKVQQMFNSKQIITAEVSEVNQDLLPSLERLSFVSKVTLEETFDKVKKLTLHLNDNKDRRGFVGQFLVDKKCGLLSLSKESLPLEEIFLQVTHQQEYHPPEGLS